MTKAFCAAYNRRDPSAMAALLAPTASTELVGSGFPPEQGPGEIQEGSFAHLLEGDDLSASLVRVEDAEYVAFHAADGVLDSLAALTVEAGAITKLRYHTRWHDEAFVERVAAAL